MISVENSHEPFTRFPEQQTPLPRRHKWRRLEFASAASATSRKRRNADKRWNGEAAVLMQ